MNEMKKAEAARVDEVKKAEQAKADQRVQLERQNVTQKIKKIHEEEMNKSLIRAGKKKKSDYNSLLRTLQSNGMRAEKDLRLIVHENYLLKTQVNVAQAEVAVQKM